MIKLDIGAGGKSSDPSFISVDKYVLEADIIADMWDLPFEDEVVDVIFASHCLEHISKFKVHDTLKEWERVLKFGGRAQIIVPDLVWCCLWAARHPNRAWGLDVVYGNQKHEGEFHKTGFTPEIMFAYLEETPNLVVAKWEYFAGTLEDIDKDYESLPESTVIFQRCINFELLKV